MTEYLSVGYDKELGELIIEGPKGEKEDMASYYLAGTVGFSTLVIFFWIAIIILL